MVTPATTRALIVVFAPHAALPDRLVRVLDLTAERIVRFAGGVERLRAVLGPPAGVKV